MLFPDFRINKELNEFLGPFVLKKRLEQHNSQQSSSFNCKIHIQLQSDILPFFFLALKKSTILEQQQNIEIACLDRNLANYRFCIFFIFLNINYASRIIIKMLTDGLQVIESLTFSFKSGNWLEREVFDLFGIYYLNNGDLRRLLTDYGFVGFALRKDYPVYGLYEKYYSISENTICIAPISLAQEFRFVS